MQIPNVKGVRVLTPSEQDMLDPSRNIRNMLDNIPDNDSYWADIPPAWAGVDVDSILDAYYEQLRALPEKHRFYVQHALDHSSKIGRQGGRYSKALMFEKVYSYFTAGSLDGNLPKALITGRDYFLALLREKIEEYGRPQLSTPKIKRTFGGIPSGQAKGSFAAETLGVNKVSLQRFFPDTPGQRRMRGKDRGIFMAATANVRAQESYLKGARDWLKRYFPEYLGAWMNPKQFVDPQITKAINRHNWFLAWDYKSMDINFRKRIAMEIIYPIYELLFPDMAISIGAHFEQNFEVPVFFGDFILEGEHSLLSGENITNDFETLYTVILILGAAILAGYHPSVILMLLAIGDDMAAAFKSRAIAERIFEVATDATAQVRMEFSKEKCALEQEQVVFCRKAYYPAARRTPDGVIEGAYPGNLVINQVLWPESPIFHEATSIVADLTRLDNAHGSPDWGWLVQVLAQFHTYDSLRSESYEHIVEMLTNHSFTDWWYDLYEEKWQPTASFSFKPFLNATPRKRRVTFR